MTNLYGIYSKRKRLTWKGSDRHSRENVSRCVYLFHAHTPLLFCYSIASSTQAMLSRTIELLSAHRPLGATSLFVPPPSASSMEAALLTTISSKQILFLVTDTSNLSQFTPSLFRRPLLLSMVVLLKSHGLTLQGRHMNRHIPGMHRMQVMHRLHMTIAHLRQDLNPNPNN